MTAKKTTGAKTTSDSAISEAGAGVGNRRTVSDAERDVVTSRIDQITDIGIDEAWMANVKRTYDEFQHESLTDVRRSRDFHEKMDNLSVQVLQNAIETTNLVGKQAVRHADITIVDAAKSEDAFMVLLAREVAKQLQVTNKTG